MKMGWKIEPLGELCEFQRGLTYAKSDEVEVSDNIVLRATNIDLTTNLLNFAELKYINDRVVVSDSKKVKKGSLMICTASGSKSHLGKVAYIDDNYDYAFGGFMGMITPKDDLVPKYLFHLMTSDAYRNFISELSDGANINNLKFDDLKKFLIPHPAISEQQRIVAILDEILPSIDKAKENAEINLQNAEEIFESYLQSVFANKGKGWEEKTLGDNNLIEIIDGDRGKNYPTQKDFLDKGFCLFMNTKNVRPNGFDFKTTMFISEKKDNAMGKGKLKRKDVVMTTRGTIGNLGVYSDDIEYDNIRINSGMLIFRPNPKELLPEYLFEILRSGIIKEQIKKHVSGAAQPQLPIKTLVNFRFPVPKLLSEQRSIVTKLNALSAETIKLEAIYQQKRGDLEELKKSILQKAFNGELAEAHV